jgi:hypothetical protein
LSGKSIFNDNIEEEIEFVASHFYELEGQSDFLVGIDLPTIERVLDSRMLRLTDEDSLLAFVCNHFCDPRPLLGYVQSEYLSVSGISRFLEHISVDNLDSHIWSSLCRRLILPVAIGVSKSKSNSQSVSSTRFINPGPVVETFEYVTNSPFSGIISSLTLSCGGNIHENVLVGSCESRLDEFLVYTKQSKFMDFI